MSPEFVDRLIILDCRRVSDNNLIGYLYYIDPPADRELRVRWGIGDLPDGFISVAGGVAFISTEEREGDKVKVEKIENFSLASSDDLSYRLSEGLKRGLSKLMFILILPENYTLAEAVPGHHGIRDFDGRIGLYWVLFADELQRTNIEWTIAGFDKNQEDLKSVLKKINSNYHANYAPILPAQTFHIFLSYRRSDSRDITERIYDRLVQEFGKEAVFRDIYSIELGVDFRAFIDEKIKVCRVMLVVIGDQWLQAKDDSGNRRLDDENDVLRIEVESALQLGIPVVPVLVNGMSMPSGKDLPSSISDLANRNAADVRHDPDFHNDMNRLIAGLKKHLGLS
jgi:TIR domain